MRGSHMLLDEVHIAIEYLRFEQMSTFDRRFVQFAINMENLSCGSSKTKRHVLCSFCCRCGSTPLPLCPPAPAAQCLARCRLVTNLINPGFSRWIGQAGLK